MPELPQSATDVEVPMPEFIKDFEWRFTTVGKYFVYASDDKQLAKMIKKAKTLKPRTVKGPLIYIDMDIGSYLEFVTSMVPEASAQFGGQMPRLGRMHITYDFKKGRALSSSSIQMQDIKKIVAHFSQGAFGTGEAELIFEDEDEDEKEVASDEKPEKKVDDAKEKAVYWFRKGALCSTYGNNEAAIKYFEKALVLDPQRSGAYFEQGVSYGQLDDYEKAIAMINKALAMEPQNGLYYYGRGRVYLLAGDQDMAMEDFNKAADLGDEDARNYLSYIDETQN
jgi:tetratricopeptide (TPR) repeat protein